MKLYVDKIDLAGPTRREPVALALVLTPLGCEGPSGTFSMIQLQHVLGPINEEGWMLAAGLYPEDAGLDPEDFLAVFLQVWETSKPERVHSLLAALRGRLDRTPLGQRLVRCEGIPSEGIARAAGAEVMHLLSAAFVHAGDVLVFDAFAGGPHDPLEDWKDGTLDVVDFRGVAAVCLRLEMETSGQRLPETLSWEAPGVTEDSWRSVNDTDVVDETYRIRNPYGEEQRITDRHDGDRATFDDGDTWTVAAMAAAGWETTFRESGINDGGTRYPPSAETSAPWRRPRTWSEVTVGREVLLALGGKEVAGEVIFSSQVGERRRAELLPADSLSPTAPEDGEPVEGRRIPIVVTRLKDFKIRDPAPVASPRLATHEDPLLVDLGGGATVSLEVDDPGPTAGEDA